MKKIFLLSIFCVLSLSLLAIDEVTLTTMGDGATLEEAKNNALRNALEQAYGAFMSSSTIILNDELAKDEIVSVTSGNIKNYKILGSVKNDDGTVTVSCTSTISLNKLLNYMQSTGAEVSFSGNSFAANMQLQKLNSHNREKVLEHLAEKLASMRGLCDYELKLGEPSGGSEWCGINGTIYFKFNAQSINYSILLYNTLSQLSESDRPNVRNLDGSDIDVPNMGSFYIKEPLPEALKKDLNEYKYFSNYFYNGCQKDGKERLDVYKDYIFFRDIMRFVIYDNLHPNVDLSSDLRITYAFNQFHFLDKEGKEVGLRQKSFLPYACIPTQDKYSYETRDYSLGPYRTQAEEDLARGKIKVRPPYVKKKETNIYKWWTELVELFYYPVKNYVDFDFNNTYAQPGDRFASMKIYIRIPTKDIAKYTTFGIKYNPNLEEEYAKADQLQKEREEFNKLLNQYMRYTRDEDLLNYYGKDLAKQIAQHYFEGKGVTQNEKKGITWLEIAAKHGDVNAMANLGGYYYLWGKGCEPNPRTALYWLQKAIDAGATDTWTIVRYEKAKEICNAIKDVDSENMRITKTKDGKFTLVTIKDITIPQWEYTYTSRF